MIISGQKSEHKNGTTGLCSIPSTNSNCSVFKSIIAYNLYMNLPAALIHWKYELLVYFFKKSVNVKKRRNQKEVLVILAKIAAASISVPFSDSTVPADEGPYRRGSSMVRIPMKE